MDESSNKRLARNTIMLYVRTFIIMFVSLFTVRIILQALGVDDYGIHNVVIGFVSMFSFVSGSLSGVLSRFFAIEIESGNKLNLNKLFSNALVLIILITGLLILLVEIIGVWFINFEMNISPDRVLAANYVLQFSILSLIFQTLIIPFDALIVAHEKMSAYAWISIFDGALKLAIAYLVLLHEGDRLVFYSLLLFLESLSLCLIYCLYCKKSFTFSLRLSYNKDLSNQIFSLVGWDLWGSSSYILKNYGVNLIINIFCGVSVNAARGIALQVNTAITKFSGGFLTALRPQIIKAYANNEQKRLNTLINFGTKASCFLLMLISIPVIVECKFILSLWLNNVPEHTINFVILVIILSISEGTLVFSHNAALMATGKIKMSQLITGIIQLLNIPFSYYLLERGAKVEYTYIIAILIAHTCCFIRVFYLRKELTYSVSFFIKNVYFKILAVGIISFIGPFLFTQYISSSWFRLIFTTLSSITLSLLSILLIGCDMTERKFIIQTIKKYIK